MCREPRGGSGVRGCSNEKVERKNVCQCEGSGRGSVTVGEEMVEVEGDVYRWRWCLLGELGGGGGGGGEGGGRGWFSRRLQNFQHFQRVSADLSCCSLKLTRPRTSFFSSTLIDWSRILHKILTSSRNTYIHTHLHHTVHVNTYIHTYIPSYIYTHTFFLFSLSLS